MSTDRISSRLRNLPTLIPAKLWFIIIVAFLLRLYHLGYHNLWHDEMCSFFEFFPLKNLLRFWDPPLYFSILAGWTKIFGFSEFSLRFPSLLFSLASIPVLYLLGKELFNKSAGLYAAAIAALSPFYLWYAQEARSYSLMLFLALLSGYFQFLFIKRREDKFLYWCVISSILGIYTHQYYIFFAITQLICCITLCGKKWSVKMLIVSLLVPLSFIPQLRGFWPRMSLIRKSWWPPPSNWKSLLITIENFNLGYNSHLFAYLIFNILSLILFISAIWLIKREKSIRRAFIFCLILFIVPILLAFIFSKLVASIYLYRGLIISTLYYYLILGLGISAFRKRVLKFIVIGFTSSLLIVGVYGFYKDWMPTEYFHHVGVHLKKPVKPVAEFIMNNSGPNDIIAFTNDSIVFPFLWYSEKNNFLLFLTNPHYYMKKKSAYRNPFSRKYCFIFGPKYLTYEFGQPRKENKYYIPLHKVNSFEFENLWLLSCNWPRDGNLDENSIVVRKWLDKNFKREMTREFEGLWMFKYVKE